VVGLIALATGPSAGCCDNAGKAVDNIRIKGDLKTMVENY
jgi:hypothetical protein